VGQSTGIRWFRLIGRSSDSVIPVFRQTQPVIGQNFDRSLKITGIQEGGRLAEIGIGVIETGD
jgi:hypothetical protein